MKTLRLQNRIKSTKGIINLIKFKMSWKLLSLQLSKKNSLVKISAKITTSFFNRQDRAILRMQSAKFKIQIS
jgi:hypothetical protein